MSKKSKYLAVGDYVHLTGSAWAQDYPTIPKYVQITSVTPSGIFAGDAGSVGSNGCLYGPDFVPEYAVEYVSDADMNWQESAPKTQADFAIQVTDATDPSYYTFGDVEVRQISGHLTGFGAQALQYVARATRMDGQNKGDAVEDLRKSIKFIQWEIERLEAGK